jgi:hypothetical protein
MCVFCLTLRVDHASYLWEQTDIRIYLSVLEIYPFKFHGMGGGANLSLFLAQKVKIGNNGYVPAMFPRWGRNAR